MIWRRQVELTDIVSPEKRSRMMAGIKSKNTRPEMIVRQLLHGAGYRYRLHDRNFPGKPDLVLKKYHMVIFINGCFWHGHENCHLFRLPKSRTEFWKEKIGGNMRRDVEKIRVLHENKWRVMVIWECALKGRRKMTLDNLLTGMENYLHDSKTDFHAISGY